MKMSHIKPAASFAYFLALGFAAAFILHKAISLTTIMQIFSILAVLIIVSSKFILPKIKNPAKTIVLFLLLLPVVLLIYFLILTTNLIFSPFIILTHFFAIGVAFLISPQISVTYIIATLTLIITQLSINQSLLPLVTNSPLLSLLYFISYVGLIPFSFILARQYKFKEEWAQILEKQIATSQTQEEELLKNIKEAIFVVDTNFKLVYLNEAACQFSKYNQQDLDKDFPQLFAFKDDKGRDLPANSLPLAQALNSKVQFFMQNIQIAAKDKNFATIDLKILPAIAADGPMGLILIVEEKSAHKKLDKQQETTASLALAKFLNLLTGQKQQITTIRQKIDPEKITTLLNQNELLSRLAQDFIYVLRLESGKTNLYSQLIDLGKIIQDLIEEQKPQAQIYSLELMPIVTQQPKPIQPKTLQIPLEKRIFDKLYVIGNPTWIKDALGRILYLIFLTSIPKSQIMVEVKQEQELLKVTFTSKSKITKDKAAKLFEKFDPSLVNIPQLANATGLEGYIAKSLITRMGANLEINDAQESLTFTTTLGTRKT